MKSERIRIIARRARLTASEGTTVRTLLDRLARLLALGCWHGGHYHLLWMTYPDVAERVFAEDDPAPPAAGQPEAVPGPPVPRMRPAEP